SAWLSPQSSARRSLPSVLSPCSPAYRKSFPHWFIHWYRQLPGRGPAFLVSAVSGSKEVPDPEGRLWVSADRRSSALLLAQPRLGDAAVYYCALVAREAKPGLRPGTNCFGRGGSAVPSEPAGGAAAPPMTLLTWNTSLALQYISHPVSLLNRDLVCATLKLLSFSCGSTPRSKPVDAETGVQKRSGCQQPKQHAQHIRIKPVTGRREYSILGEKWVRKHKAWEWRLSRLRSHGNI
uniref:Ig-like domain-containing protein n=1 Tax=Meleagris gallopavo TaxID=9103 RepID=A0A803XLZ9_MELGA